MCTGVCIVGAKDSPTWANHSLWRNATENETLFPEAALSVTSNFNIGDYFEPSPTVEKNNTLGSGPQKMLTKGEFTLAKFVSNARGVLSTINWASKPTNSKVKALAADYESRNWNWINSLTP